MGFPFFGLALQFGPEFNYCSFGIIRKPVCIEFFCFFFSNYASNEVPLFFKETSVVRNPEQEKLTTNLRFQTPYIVLSICKLTGSKYAIVIVNFVDMLWSF